MDDARVTHVSLQEVMNAEAYMLFYRVVDHPITMQLKNKIEQQQQQQNQSKSCSDAAVKTVGTTLKETNDDGSVPSAKQKQQDQIVAQQELKETEKSLSSLKPMSLIKSSSNSRTTTSITTSSTTPGELKTTSGDKENNKSNNSKRNNSNNNNNNKKRKAPQFIDGESWARAKTRLSNEYIPLFRKVQDYISEHANLTPAFFQIICDEASKQGAKIGNGPNTIICSDDIVGGFKKYESGVKEFFYNLVKNHNKNSENGCSSFFLNDSSNKKPRLDKTIFEVLEAADETLL